MTSARTPSTGLRKLTITMNRPNTMLVRAHSYFYAGIAYPAESEPDGSDNPEPR
jgi:hypothetical protein